MLKTYIYPENLRASVRLWFWSVRDFVVICAGVLLSVVLFARLWTVVPFAMTACFAFLTIRAEESAIIDYIFNAVRFFVTSQQKYYWKDRSV